MPYLGAGAHIIIAIFFAIHAVRTGQNNYWLFILLAFPFLGSVVYFLPPYVITPEQIDFLAEVASEGIDIATRSDISVAVPSNFHPDFRDPG